VEVSELWILKFHGQNIFELYPSTYLIDTEGSILAMNLRYRTSGLRCDRGARNVFLRVIYGYD